MVSTGRSSVPRVSRRRLTQGAVWAVPAVVLAAQAPAAASSIVICPGSCFTLDWESTTQGFLTHTPANSDNTSLNWTRAGSVSSTGATCPTPLAVSVTQQRKSGYPLNVNSSATSFTRTDAYGDFSIGARAYSSFTIPTAQPGLVLSQAASTTAPALESVTFDFGVPVKSVSFTIYDLTRTTGTNASSYVDAVSFDKVALVTAIGDTSTGSNLVKGTSLASPSNGAPSQSISGLTEYVWRGANFPTSTGNRNVSVEVTMGGATSFTMNYWGMVEYISSPNTNGHVQWIVVGDLTICQ